MSFDVADPGYAVRVRESFARQRFMALIGATIARIEPGAVDLMLPWHESLGQQNGYGHAAVTTAIADVACGYAAISLLPAGEEVLSVEFKVNLLRPAVGERFVAEGRVLKPGRSITVTRADVYAERNGGRSLIATMLATMMRQPAAA